jgi:hypothetical protein
LALQRLTSKACATERLGADMTSNWTAEKKMATLWSALLLLAILSPFGEYFKKRRADSFPLSFYPMFANQRPEIESITYMIGLDAKGERHRIPYRYYFSGGLNQAREQLRNVVKLGEKRQRDVCLRVAKKIRAERKSNGPLAKVETIQIMSGEYRLDKYFGERDFQPQREDVRMECRVDERK